MAFTSFKSIIDTLNNEEMSFGDKLSSIFMSLPMVIGGFASVATGAVNVIQGLSSSTRALIGVEEGLKGAFIKSAEAKLSENVVMSNG